MASLRLKELREHNNLSQHNVADILNIKHAQYWRYESGKRDLPVKYLKILRDYYKTTSDYILGFSEDDEKKPYIK